jgi:hypothetical protein
VTNTHARHRFPLVRLWSAGPLICACQQISATAVEICLEVNGRTFDRQTFTDSAAATQFVLDKMHAYGGR